MILFLTTYSTSEHFTTISKAFEECLLSLHLPDYMTDMCLTFTSFFTLLYFIKIKVTSRYYIYSEISKSDHKTWQIEGLHKKRNLEWFFLKFSGHFPIYCYVYWSFYRIGKWLQIIQSNGLDWIIYYVHYNYFYLANSIYKKLLYSVIEWKAQCQYIGNFHFSKSNTSEIDRKSFAFLVILDYNCIVLKKQQ